MAYVKKDWTNGEVIQEGGDGQHRKWYCCK